MRIYEMTATFGKLKGETLTLKPGLNIIEAPNEWGKSTWCAFLLSMLYGVDTRAKTTKTALADKEHYQPWSGQPMSGRMKLNWNGRDITIERNTKGRIPMGEFSAYETASGLPVRELTGDNCGEMLLGAEQSVWKRAGFIRLSDLPITRDDALCRRLNALVTTGDESGDGERLARELKNLKNKCRYNKSGVLPQLEEELENTECALEELRDLQTQAESLAGQMEDLENQQKKLQNHLENLKNQEAGADALRVREAREGLEAAEKKRSGLQKVCEKLPQLSQLQKKQEQMQKLSQNLEELLKEDQTIPRMDPPPVPPAAFGGMAPKEAVRMAVADQKTYETLQLNFTIVWILAAICCVAASVLCFALGSVAVGGLFIMAAAGFAGAGFAYQKIRVQKMKSLTEKYGDENPDNWLLSAKYYFSAAVSYEQDSLKDRDRRVELNGRIENLRKLQESSCGGRTVSETMEKLQKMIKYRESLQAAEKEVGQAKIHLQAVTAMAKKSGQTVETDDLYLTEAETLIKQKALKDQQQKLLNQVGQYQGRMEALGTEAQLLLRQQSLKDRIRKLENFLEALTIAQENLQQVTQDLQRRFAPKITRRAQELMWRMTGGRYEKLTLEEDFSLKTGAETENVLHSALWRSEGTMDQLYLSLRLAVSEALTENAPLVLDDALVRFDEKRMEKALEILAEEKKQVILFTCQSREGRAFPEAVISRT